MSGLNPRRSRNKSTGGHGSFLLGPRGLFRTGGKTENRDSEERRSRHRRHTSSEPPEMKDSRVDDIIARATAEGNSADNWDLILEVCDRVKSGGQDAARAAINSIFKRLQKGSDVQLLTLSLLDSCVSNCGKPFHEEVAAKDFVSEMKKLATSSNDKVAQKTRKVVQRWVDEDLKGEPSSNPIKMLNTHLKEPSSSAGSGTAASSQQEADDLAKAIQLSLREQEAKGGGARASTPPPTTTSSLYPSQDGVRPDRVVKALYDFEAAEDNELTFKAGDFITVTDDRDANWWKGKNHNASGLFPASFVTSDLSAEVEAEVISKKKVQFNNTVDVKTVQRIVEAEPPVIDEQKLDHCTGLLHEADPTGERPDTEELLVLEEQCAAMGPLINREIGSIDTLHNELSELLDKITESLGMYGRIMQEEKEQFTLQHQQPNQMPQYVQGQAGAAPGYPMGAPGPYMPQGPQMDYGGQQQVQYAPVQAKTVQGPIASPLGPQQMPHQVPQGHVQPPPLPGAAQPYQPSNF